MSIQDLTGRDLDLAVARALGYVWWAGWDAHGNPGVSYLRPDEHPPAGWRRIEEPDTAWHSSWLPGYECDGGRIPELFAEIRERCPGPISLHWMGADGFPGIFQAVAAGRHNSATGSTPNEALARLLLMVTQR